MTTPERYVEKVAEAERALTYRLADWGVKDAEDKAHDFVAALIGQGWSPHRPVTALPTPPRNATPPPEGWKLRVLRDIAEHRQAETGRSDTTQGDQ